MTRVCSYSHLLGCSYYPQLYHQLKLVLCPDLSLPPSLKQFGDPSSCRVPRRIIVRKSVPGSYCSPDDSAPRYKATQALALVSPTHIQVRFQLLCKGMQLQSTDVTIMLRTRVARAEGVDKLLGTRRNTFLTQTSTFANKLG